MDKKEAFLAKSHYEAKQKYKEAALHKKTGIWDWIIITASNERQADSYRIQVKKRMEKGRWPIGSQCLVVPDLHGERIGSGGATLNALYELSKQIPAKEIDRKRIALLHSGGDSKRIPQYSVCGKLFSPVPKLTKEGERSTIFDEMMAAIAGIPERIKSGLLVLPGDTEVLFNCLQMDLEHCDAAGLSMKASIAEGVHHGVFVKNKADRFIDYFLHKQPEQVLKEFGAADVCNQVDIDTGCIWFGRKVLSEILGLIMENGVISDRKFQKYVNSKVCLSFYGDFVYPLAEASTLEEYYKQTPEGVFSCELKECREELWKAFRGYRMELVRLNPAKYIHYGTTHEYLDLMTKDMDSYQYLGWKRKLLTNYEFGNCAVNNAFIEPAVSLSGNVYVEDSIIGLGVAAGNEVVLSNVVLENATVPDGVVLHGLIMADGSYLCRIYGVHDNPKNSANGTFLGTTLRKFLQRYGLDNSDIWKESVASIWNAELFTAEASMEAAVKSALNLYRFLSGQAEKEEIQRWKSKKRYSLNQSFNRADMQKILQWQEEIHKKVKLCNYLKAIRAGENAAVSLEKSGIDTSNLKEMEEVLHLAQKEEFPVNMRLYLALSDICKREGIQIDGYGADWYEDCAYGVVRQVITGAVTKRHIWEKSHGSFLKDKAEVRLPARVNFCGSPSDAAPYCLEHGGTMLDAAVLLKGDYPIQATVERLERQAFVFESVDQEICQEFDTLSAIRDCANPYDPFALHKAVLLAAGLVPLERSSLSMEEMCSSMGGGLLLRTIADIPKGSGLGTSSIVAAACIKAIREAFGQDVEDQTIYAQVFLAEQLMATGGGWQDQVGGLHNGVKYFYANPGNYQEIFVENLKLSPAVKKELNDRFVLIFSGQRRLARNVLREELNQCIRNSEETADAIEKIRRICAFMRYELERGNITAFGKLLTEQFELVKRIDRGATNTCIDYIFDVCEDLLDGRAVCGAGGGGFLQAVLKKGVSKEELEERIHSEFMDSGVVVWDCEIAYE